MHFLISGKLQNFILNERTGMQKVNAFLYYMYYESSFVLADALQETKGPQRSLDHTLRIASLKKCCSIIIKKMLIEQLLYSKFLF